MICITTARDATMDHTTCADLAIAVAKDANTGTDLVGRLGPHIRRKRQVVAILQITSILTSCVGIVSEDRRLH